ncbi:MAG TPA: DnaA/Hda family protein [Longimicrobium sp.]|nr:DnaA/Hda family protein [Longimicrobium sp.]
MRFQQDPRFTFDTFVVGPGNRMAAAAARLVAESPGTSYNPLFVYGAPGTGKTHLLHAVGALALAVRPDIRVLYDCADGLAEQLSNAVASGALEGFRDSVLEAGIVLVDGVDALAGKSRTQKELLELWDELLRLGVQLIFAGEFPPSDLDGVEGQLRSRLADGLTVDIAPPEPETRREIVRRHAADRGVALADGVDDALARLPAGSSRDLASTVDRIAAVQAERGAQVSAGEVHGLMTPEVAIDEFQAFLSDITFTVGQLVEEAPWRKSLAEAILRWEGEGMRTRRLEAALEADTAPDMDAVLASFTADVERLRSLHAELAAVDPRAAESPVLADPDRVAEAEAMLSAARAAAERRVAQEPAAPPTDRWYFTNAEKVLWSWVALEDRVIEELA